MAADLACSSSRAANYHHYTARRRSGSDKRGRATIKPAETSGEVDASSDGARCGLAYGLAHSLRSAGIELRDIEARSEENPAGTPRRGARYGITCDCGSTGGFEATCWTNEQLRGENEHFEWRGRGNEDARLRQRRGGYNTSRRRQKEGMRALRIFASDEEDAWGLIRMIPQKCKHPNFIAAVVIFPDGHITAPQVTGASNGNLTNGDLALLDHFCCVACIGWTTSMYITDYSYACNVLAT